MHRFSIRYQRADEESDSDESFHCCGKPEDLLESPPTPPPEPKQPYAQSYREVFVPEDQDFYCYQSGLERQHQENPVSTCVPPPISGTASVPRVLGRTHSSESDKTIVDSGKIMKEETLLVIRTGVTSSSPSRRMSQAPSKIPKAPSPKPKSRRATLNVFRASSLSRALSQKSVADASSPTKKSRPPRARFSVLQATRRFSKCLYDIKEVDKRSTLQPQGSSKDISE